MASIAFEEYKNKLNNLRPALDDLGGALHLDEARNEVEKLEEESAQDGFWNDTENSQRVQKRIKTLKHKLERYAKLTGAWEDMLTMCEMAVEEDDDSMLPDLESEFQSFEETLESMRLETLLTGEYDANNAILTFHAGAGGTEAQDWTSMLYRMYNMWAERHGYTVKLMDYLDGDEAGIKSATIMIEGENAYGFLKSENGIHRLVRISPFDASGRRHTSFAAVEVMPEITEDSEIELRDEDIKMDVYRSLAELTAAGGEKVPGLSTGFSAVDSKINGLNDSDLLLLAARPGMGKTSMALNVALSAAKESGKTVAIFSLEMSREQLVTRLIATEGLVENTRLVTGNLRESDWVKIAEAASALSRTDIRIDDNPLLTVADMNAKCRRLDNLGLVVIDYLQLMTSAGGKGYSGENRQQAVSDISRMLKIMAKELQVPVLCLSQLSRANEKREDKRPMLSDLRESGAIEQDADIVMFLYRDDYYNEDSEKRNIAECIIAKNRHGETGKVPLRWMPEYTAFGTLESRYDEDE